MSLRPAGRRSGRTTHRSPVDLPTGPVRTSTGVVELLRDPARPSAVTVFINDAESSYVDLADPRHLEFEYMQQMSVVIEALLAPSPAPVRAVHLGGAGCALARAWDAERPGSAQLAVELDGELARLARSWFTLPRSPRLRIRVADAREALESLTPGSWDVVVRDVFAGIQVPSHVRTVEAARAARAAISDDGLYLVNLTDRPPLPLARAEVATMAEVFEHVALIADPAILRGRRYGNVVLVGSSRPVETSRLDRDLRGLPLPVRLMTGAELTAFAGTYQPLRDELLQPAADDAGA
ncbi:spermidine synthase [Georgenia sunbinii]|uniref:spermidine synthase n=1 Tax=Georgenia sunbinii TaxID=3117728 RepID=UPI002F2619E7